MGFADEAEEPQAGSSGRQSQSFVGGGDHDKHEREAVTTTLTAVTTALDSATAVVALVNFDERQFLRYGRVASMRTSTTSTDGAT